MADITKESKVNHILTVNKVKIAIEEYASTYKDIGDVVGIKEMTDKDTADDFGSIPNLKYRAKIVTFTVATKEKKRYTVQCSIDKASTAPAALIGKKVGGSTIKSVSIKRRRTRR